MPRAPGEPADFYAGVRDALLTGAAPPVLAEEAVAVIEVLDAARRVGPRQRRRQPVVVVTGRRP